VVSGSTCRKDRYGQVSTIPPHDCFPPAVDAATSLTIAISGRADSQFPSIISTSGPLSTHSTRRFCSTSFCTRFLASRLHYSVTVMTVGKLRDDGEDNERWDKDVEGFHKGEEEKRSGL